MAKNRKFVIIVGDGMADWPLEELGGKTPLGYSKTPNMDRLAKEGISGLTRTVPSGMNPGSDTANLSIFGYNPQKYYTGRAPLEAINMGIQLGLNDVAFRCNLVTLTDGVMEDFSADHIDSNLTKVVIEEVARNIKHPDIEFYPGISYRSLMIWRNYPHKDLSETTPPHDIQGKMIAQYMPREGGFELLRQFTEQSWEIIQDSLKIKRAAEQYKGKPTSIWLWGGGTRPNLVPLTEQYGITGYTISAVDLIHGIGVAAGLKPVDVEGATGYLDTNYGGKVEAALNSMEEGDYVFLHVEAPDEAGHEGSVEKKIKAIEDFDAKVVGPMMEGLKKYDDYTILLMPDHPTPISTRTHSDDPVPFCVYSSKGIEKPMSMVAIADGYSEVEAEKTGVYVDDASTLIDIVVSGNFNK